MMNDKPTKKPRVKLIGVEGDVFALADIVRETLLSAGQLQNARDFRHRLPDCRSRDAALSLMKEYVEVY